MAERKKLEEIIFSSPKISGFLSGVASWLPGERFRKAEILYASKQGNNEQYHTARFLGGCYMAANWVALGTVLSHYASNIPIKG